MRLRAMARDKSEASSFLSFLPTAFGAVSMFREKKKKQTRNSGWLLPWEGLFHSYFTVIEMSFQIYTSILEMHFK